MKKIAALIAKTFLAVTVILLTIAIFEFNNLLPPEKHYKKYFEQAAFEETIAEDEAENEIDIEFVKVAEIFNAPNIDNKEPREVVITQVPQLSGNLQEIVVKAIDENNRHKINDAIAAGYQMNQDCSKAKFDEICNLFNYALNQHKTEDKQVPNYKMLQFLLKRNADINAKVNENGDTIFHVAVRTGIENTKYMLENKANVTVVNNNGDTLIDYAQSVDIIDFLIESGIDINYPSVDGSPLLKEYRKNGQSDKVNHLVVKGADINTKDNNGVHLIHEAVKANDIKFTQLLIKKGVEVDVSDYSGKKTSDYARGDEYKEIAKILINAKMSSNQKK